MDDHPEKYFSLTYEYWCDLLSTIEVEDERKRAAVQIKKIASAKSASLSDSNISVTISRKKKANTCVLRSNKSSKRAYSSHHGMQCHCVLCKKAGMPERKYTLHIEGGCTGVPPPTGPSRMDWEDLWDVGLMM